MQSLLSGSLPLTSHPLDRGDRAQNLLRSTVEAGCQTKGAIEVDVIHHRGINGAELLQPAESGGDALGLQTAHDRSNTSLVDHMRFGDGGLPVLIALENRSGRLGELAHAEQLGKQPLHQRLEIRGK